MTSRARTTLLVVAIVVVVASVACFTNPVAVPGLTGGYGRTTLTVVDDETGETLTTVNARVADACAKRFTGLSDTESLAENGGMWFVHDSSGAYTYVMRDMDFPLDIVFVAGDGTITYIHHAELGPEGTNESDLIRYHETGRYVLELPYGYTNETEIDTGDRVGVEQKRDARRAGGR